MRNYRILFLSLFIAALVVLAKFLLHWFHLEVIVLGSLHTSVVTGTFFVLGFLLSATIADYKESEKIPADFAGNTQNMYADAITMHKKYPDFDLKGYKKQLLKVLEAFRNDVRHKSNQAHHEVHKLSMYLLSMENAKVPPNFITKVKQEQAQLVKSLLRVNYIQSITVIPSATILARSIVVIAIGLLLFTEIEPFYGGMALTAIISLILIYVLKLIRVISTPFHQEGKTQDDVSMFLIDQAVDYIKKEK